MQTQFLILAENIVYKNNKLTCINILDQFHVVKRPTEAHFDLVAICGPNWEQGEYNISIKIQFDDEEMNELGSSTITVPNSDFVYNALAPNMKIALKETTQYVKFFVYRNEELIIQRNYKASSIFLPQGVS